MYVGKYPLYILYFIFKQTLLEAFDEGALQPTYMLKWLAGIANDLQTLEADAAPDGWQCLWNRYAAVVFNISNPVAVHLILIHYSTTNKHNTTQLHTTNIRRIPIGSQLSPTLFVRNFSSPMSSFHSSFVPNKIDLPKLQDAVVATKRLAHYCLCVCVLHKTYRVVFTN